jgi:Zn-dependent peptidase ImmA (M78 family)
MDPFKYLIKDVTSGGRGSTQIQEQVASLLYRYKQCNNGIIPPIDHFLLATLQNARIIYRASTENWVASVLPIKSGFIISVNKSLPYNRQRYAICHEIAHTFFIASSGGQMPLHDNPINHDKKQELLCFWAAREMLVPADLLENRVKEIGYDNMRNLRGILKVAEDFEVSPDIISYRLTHDLAILGNSWIVLWYRNNKSKSGLLPKSLYPRHISESITKYAKDNILDNLRNIILDMNQRVVPHEKEIIVGRKKYIRLKIRIEHVKRNNLVAIAWVTPLS